MTVYAVLGCTATVWAQRAWSDPVAAPASAPAPERTGVLTTEPVPALHVQPESEPASKPGFVSRLAADAGAEPATSVAATSASVAMAANNLDRFIGRPPDTGAWTAETSKDRHPLTDLRPHLSRPITSIV